jgi:NADH dehydrogenase [ubiquinone] 1 alpha subcomplex assembly factor 7
MSRDVAERIRRRIEENGPITFDEFMREALYGSGGFYASTPVGKRGHFVTSPHVHPVFGRLVGAALEEMSVLLGRPAPLRVVEVGAGDGTLARELIAGFERAGVELVYEAVEASAGARDILSAITPTVVKIFDQLEPLDPGLVVANELLDNLPFRRVRRRGVELFEVRVGLEGGAFVEVESPLDGASAHDIESSIDADGVPEIDEGHEVVVPTGAFAFVDEIGRSLRRGYALLIDYAATGPDSDDVHGYRDHRVLADVLDEPGSSDITAGVDLGAIARRARAAGLNAFESVSQREALVALGLDAWLRDELEHQRRMLAESRGLDAVRTFGGRSRARLLADRAALGRLRWLVIASHGLPEPRWLHAARSARPPVD